MILTRPLMAALLLTMGCASSDDGSVATGDGWRLTARDSEEGPCLELSAEGESTYGCGFEVPERRTVGYFAAQLGSERFLVGPVVEAAHTVRVELLDGQPIVTDAIETELGTDVYVVRVPDGSPERVVALGRGGEELGAVATPQDPWST